MHRLQGKFTNCTECRSFLTKLCNAVNKNFQQYGISGISTKTDIRIKLLILKSLLYHEGLSEILREKHFDIGVLIFQINYNILITVTISTTTKLDL